MGKTGIEWASDTRNYYLWDCSRISPGCLNCYMFEMAAQYGKPITGIPRWREAVFKEKIQPGAVYFVNSMSDTYHERAPVKWIHWIHNEAWQHPEATFLILTKRIERAYGLAPYLAWPKNLWIGTSVENADYLWRLDYLLRIPAAGHFVSVGPMLGPVPGLREYLRPAVDQPLFLSMPTRRAGLGWVIVEAESGLKRREFDLGWAREVRDMCITAGVKFMFKQGSHQLPGQKREIDGRTWDESPFWGADEKADSPYAMLPKYHALRVYFESHEPGEYAFDLAQCETAVRDYEAQIDRLEGETAEAQRVWPGRLDRISEQLKALATPIPDPLPAAAGNPSPTLPASAGNPSPALPASQGGRNIFEQVRVKRLKEEMDEARGRFFGIVRGAQAELSRLRAERMAYQVRARLIEDREAMRKAA